MLAEQIILKLKADPTF